MKKLRLLTFVLLLCGLFILTSCAPKSGEDAKKRLEAKGYEVYLETGDDLNYYKIPDVTFVAVIEADKDSNDPDEEYEL